MSDLGKTILNLLSSCESVDSLQLSSQLNVDHQKIVGSIKSLQSSGDVIIVTPKSCTKLELTKEGTDVSVNGSHEYRVYKAVPHEGISQKELTNCFPNAKVGFSKAMSNGWIKITKSADHAPVVTRQIKLTEDETQKNLQGIQEGKVSIPDSLKSEYKKRKLVSESKVNFYILSKGSDFKLVLDKPETDLSTEMLSGDQWKTLKFKPYNFNALGIMPSSGHLHPLLKVRTVYRQIFLEMGFTEMPTNRFIESSFWNFDALFQPQQHPARDAHDTFFISDPATSKEFPPAYLERVKDVHAVGGFGSKGYNYDWKLEEAQKNLLRTHTTAVSARMLYELSQQDIFKPTKYFSIDRVFRNETLDATHLAEFHQIEGLVADYNLTLGDLMGIIEQFFNKLGIKKLRFKPAYNPYTEPSLEIFSYHEGLKKWVEVGNSGVFRPEMLQPMGFSDEVTVIAWGLSLERPTMIKYGINNIRDLFGPKVNLQMVYDNPVCRLEQ